MKNESEVRSQQSAVRFNIRTIILISVLCSLTAALLGCSTRYQGTRTPLQPGDCVIFKGTNATVRANNYRAVSLNDLAHRSAVVEITRPTTLVNE